MVRSVLISPSSTCASSCQNLSRCSAFNIRDNRHAVLCPRISLQAVSERVDGRGTSNSMPGQQKRRISSVRCMGRAAPPMANQGGLSSLDIFTSCGERLS
jgi:hypothetical protein